MRLIALALLLLPACADALAQDVGDDSLMRPAMEWAGSMSMPGGVRPYVDVFSQNFVAGAAGSHLPTCNAANSCEMQCYSTSGGVWTCVDENGASIAVTQGSGVTYALSPFGYALTDVTDAKAPQLTSPPFSTLWASPHTVLIVGHSSTRSSSVQLVMGNESGNNGIEIRGEGSSFRCKWGNNAATPTTNTVQSTLGPQTSGLAMWACMKAGTGASSVYTSRGPTNTGTDATWPNDPGTTGAMPFWFGRSATAGFPWRGPLVSVTIYSTSFTEAQLQAFEQQVAGVSDFVDASPNGGREFVMVGSTAWPVTTTRLDSYGLYVEEQNVSTGVGGSGGNWAADALNANSWSSVGTPTLTLNTQSGPFATFAGGAEADLIEDNDAGAFEGLQAPVDCGGTTVGKFAVSCYVRTGTTGTTTDQVRLVVTTNGTGSTTCDFTDLTSSFVRKECVATIGGSPTATRGQVLVGDAAADTGSIIVSQCQCDRQGWMTSPKVDNVANGINTPSISSTETATWPSDSDSGEIETVFYLDHDVPDDDYDGDDAWFLFDIVNDGGVDHRIIEWYQSNIHRFRTTDGIDSTNTETAVQWELDANTAYVTRARWESCAVGYVNHWVYFDTCADVATCTATTLVVSSTDCSRVAPVGPYGPAKLGRRMSDDIFGLNGHIARLTVRQRQ